MGSRWPGRTPAPLGPLSLALGQAHSPDVHPARVPQEVPGPGLCGHTSTLPVSPREGPAHPSSGTAGRAGGTMFLPRQLKRSQAVPLADTGAEVPGRVCHSLRGRAPRWTPERTSARPKAAVGGAVAGCLLPGHEGVKVTSPAALAVLSTLSILRVPTLDSAVQAQPPPPAPHCSHRVATPPHQTTAPGDPGPAGGQLLPRCRG